MHERVARGVRLLQYGDRLSELASLAYARFRRGRTVEPIYPAAVSAARHRPEAPNLAGLAEQYGSDKGPSKHRYTELYEMLFARWRGQPLTMLEMGLQRGGPEHGNSPSRETFGVPSVQMWLEYFPEAQVYGLDVSDFSAHQTDRFRFVRCDMDSEAELDRAASELPELDLVIDDASHASHHQQLAFLRFFPKLKSGGLYIIEDLRWQPEAYEREGFTRTGDLFRWYQSFGAFEHSDPDLAEGFNRLREQFSGCFLFQEHFLSHGKDQVLVVHKQ